MPYVTVGHQEAALTYPRDPLSKLRGAKGHRAALSKLTSRAADQRVAWPPLSSLLRSTFRLTLNLRHRAYDRKRGDLTGLTKGDSLTDDRVRREVTTSL